MSGVAEHSHGRNDGCRSSNKTNKLRKSADPKPGLLAAQILRQQTFFDKENIDPVVNPTAAGPSSVAAFHNNAVSVVRSGMLEEAERSAGEEGGPANPSQNGSEKVDESSRHGHAFRRISYLRWGFEAWRCHTSSQRNFTAMRICFQSLQQARLQRSILKHWHIASSSSCMTDQEDCDPSQDVLSQIAQCNIKFTSKVYESLESEGRPDEQKTDMGMCTDSTAVEYKDQTTSPSKELELFVEVDYCRLELMEATLEEEIAEIELEKWMCMRPLVSEEPPLNPVHSKKPKSLQSEAVVRVPGSRKQSADEHGPATRVPSTSLRWRSSADEAIILRPDAEIRGDPTATQSNPLESYFQIACKQKQYKEDLKNWKPRSMKPFSSIRDSSETVDTAQRTTRNALDYVHSVSQLKESGMVKHGSSKDGESKRMVGTVNQRLPPAQPLKPRYPTKMTSDREKETKSGHASVGEDPDMTQTPRPRAAVPAPTPPSPSVHLVERSGHRQELPTWGRGSPIEQTIDQQSDTDSFEDLVAEDECLRGSIEKHVRQAPKQAFSSPQNVEDGLAIRVARNRSLHNVRFKELQWEHEQREPVPPSHDGLPEIFDSVDASQGLAWLKAYRVAVGMSVANRRAPSANTTFDDVLSYWDSKGW